MEAGLLKKYFRISESKRRWMRNNKNKYKIEKHNIILICPRIKLI